MKLLLNCEDIDVNRSDLFSQSPAYLCVRYRRPEYLRIILCHKSFDLKSSLNLSIKTNPLYLSAKYLNMGRLECFQFLINSGFKVNQQIIDYVIQSKNQTALKMVEMSNDMILTSDRPIVRTLKQLTRIKIRDIFVERSGQPLVPDLIDKCFSELPNDLKQFLINLMREY